MKKKLNPFIIIGLAFLLISAYPLFLYGREIFANNTAHNKYEVKPVNEGEVYAPRNMEFHGNEIIISDDKEDSEDESVEGSIKITINGEDYSHAAKAKINAKYNETNRYVGSLYLAELIDKEKEGSQIAIIQRISGFPKEPSLVSKQEWRLLLVDKKGNVQEEVFKEGEQGNPLYRKMLAAHVSSGNIGNYSNSVHVYPKLLFPFIYPFGIGILGLALFVFGFLKSIKNGRIR